MKISAWILTAVVASTLALVGCGKSGGDESVDTSALQASFESAEASVKESAEKAIAAVKSSDWAGAVTELKKLLEDAKLTAEQQQAVKDTLAKVQTAIGKVAGEVTEGAEKAIDDAAKAVKELPKP